MPLAKHAEISPVSPSHTVNASKLMIIESYSLNVAIATKL